MTSGTCVWVHGCVHLSVHVRVCVSVFMRLCLCKGAYAVHCLAHFPSVHMWSYIVVRTCNLLSAGMYIL